ncbi:hypothetical protein BH09VER1_BH09VER1_41550 [soil metagenome]
MAPVLYRQNRNTGGWSLVELSIVIGIILVLAAMFSPMASRAKLAAMKAKDLANLRQLAVAVLAYHSEQNILPGPVNRSVKYPTAVTPNTATERKKWVSTLLIDLGYCDSRNTIWKSPATYGENSADLSYLLNNTDYSVPQNFFGDRSGAQKSPETLLSLFANKDLAHGGTGVQQPLSQLWMACNADGDNYSKAQSSDSIYALSPSVHTPWGGRNYVFFDGHGEFFKTGTYPSVN